MPQTIINKAKKLEKKSDEIRVQLLYSQGVFGQLVSLICLGIFVQLSWDHYDHKSLLIWAGVGAAIFLVRFALRAEFHSVLKNKTNDFSPLHWEKLFALGTFATGVMWGLASYLFTGPGQQSNSVFLIIIVAGISAGTSMAYAPSKISILAFLIPSMAPLSLIYFSYGGQFYTTLSSLIVLYAVSVGGLTPSMNRFFLNAIRVNLEKEDLMVDLKEAQSKIIHSAKMAALGEMASGIAHEVNNPLAVMKFKISDMKDELSLNQVNPETMQKHLDKLDQLITRISKIIYSLRVFARQDSEDPFETSRVEDIINDTLSFAEARFKKNRISLEFKNKLTDSEASVRCRPTQMGQVLFNLLNNAYDAVSELSDGWVHIEVFNSDDKISIAVTDSGPGIPSEIAERIMQPFYTTKSPGHGTGLGLSIAYGIVEAHGGQLKLDQSAKNTRFVVELSRAPAREAHIPKAA